MGNIIIDTTTKHEIISDKRCKDFTKHTSENGEAIAEISYLTDPTAELKFDNFWRNTASL